MILLISCIELKIEGNKEAFRTNKEEDCYHNNEIVYHNF